MGSGKTTVGAHRRRAPRPARGRQRRSHREGAPVARCARSSPTTARTAFRAFETEALLEALAAPEPSVIAAAGGVVLRAREPDRAEAGQRQGRVAVRDARDARRAGDVERYTVRCWTTIPQVRCSACTKRVSRCTARWPTPSCWSITAAPTRSPRRCCDDHRVEVPLGDRSYDVLVGHGARHELAGLLPSTARRAAIVTQAGMPIDVDPGVPIEVVRDR